MDSESRRHAHGDAYNGSLYLGISGWQLRKMREKAGYSRAEFIRFMEERRARGIVCAASRNSVVRRELAASVEPWFIRLFAEFIGDETLYRDLLAWVRREYPNPDDPKPDDPSPDDAPRDDRTANNAPKTATRNDRASIDSGDRPGDDRTDDSRNDDPSEDAPHASTARSRVRARQTGKERAATERATIERAASDRKEPHERLR